MQDRTPIPPASRTHATGSQEAVIRRIIREELAQAGEQEAGVRTVVDALGSDALLEYTAGRKANISYELGKRLRDEGQLKVLKVGGELMLRLGEQRASSPLSRWRKLATLNVRVHAAARTRLRTASSSETMRA